VFIVLWKPVSLSLPSSGLLLLLNCTIIISIYSAFTVSPSGMTVSCDTCHTEHFPVCVLSSIFCDHFPSPPFCHVVCVTIDGVG
jgi:hypothetical protein